MIYPRHVFKYFCMQNQEQSYQRFILLISNIMSNIHFHDSTIKNKDTCSYEYLSCMYVTF